ncbi:OmdA domain containing protein [Nitriliruptoraceae bacterium ZYF776]|nr:OmdA domain containing protein [Profundirhabdus halotolerans]
MLELPSVPDWETWLERHHADRTSAWLVVAKRGSGLASLTTDQALDVALCFGWIDGQRRRFDDRRFLQRYSPRRAGSDWSQVNVDKVAALDAAGRMRPAGLAQVAAARADGRWAAAYPSQATATTPDDLAAALAADPVAAEAYGRLGRTGRYQVFLPLLRARDPQRRAVLLARAVAQLRAEATSA